MAYYFVESESNPLRHITQGLANMKAEMGWLSNWGFGELGEEIVREILPFGAIAWKSCPDCLQGRDDEEVGVHACVAGGEEDVGRNSVASC